MASFEGSGQPASFRASWSLVWTKAATKGIQRLISKVVGLSSFGLFLQVTAGLVWWKGLVFDMRNKKPLISPENITILRKYTAGQLKKCQKLQYPGMP